MSLYNEGMVIFLDTCLEFGKYQGETVEDIIEDDPEYIEWLIDTFDVSEEVRNSI